MIIYLRIRAPFAAYRPLTAGWFRPTAPMMTPSAAYGLLLNFAAIDSRVVESDESHDGKTPASLTRTDLPRAKIALGIPKESPRPLQQNVFQQLHNYPIGKDAGVPKEWTKGSKNNISPVKREFLSELDIVIGIDTDSEFCKRISDGLCGAFNDTRYGLPFLGDNSFLLDSADVLEWPPITNWYERIEGAKGKQSRINEAARLTTYVDRSGFSGTKSFIFMPAKEATDIPSAAAWTQVGV